MTETINLNTETLVLGYTAQELECLDPNPYLPPESRRLLIDYGEQLVRCRRCAHRLGISAGFGCAYMLPIDGPTEVTTKSKLATMKRCAATVTSENPMLFPALP